MRGSAVLNYVLGLASDKKTLFSQNIDGFITCTIESKESKPSIVMSNMRQFMSGMRSYLVVEKEQELIDREKQEMTKLNRSEKLDFKDILNEAMRWLVISPLNAHLMKLFANEYLTSGAIQLLYDNIKYAKNKPPHEFGISEKIVLPSKANVEKISSLFHQMQATDSPKEKLEILLNIVTVIYSCVKIFHPGLEEGSIGADDFPPIFVWVLVQTEMVTAEIEADYILGLSHSSMLSGESGYYLASLSSAVNALKNFKPIHKDNPQAKSSRYYEFLWEYQTFQKTGVPDKTNGIPVAPGILLPLRVETSNSQAPSSRLTPSNTLNSISTTAPTTNHGFNNTLYESGTSISEIPPTSPRPPRPAKPPLSNGPKLHNVTVTTTLTFTNNNQVSLHSDAKATRLLQSTAVEKADNNEELLHSAAKATQFLQSLAVQKAERLVTKPEITYLPLSSTPIPLPGSHAPVVTYPMSITQTPEILSLISEGSRDSLLYQPFTYQESCGNEIYDAIDSRSCSDHENIWGLKDNDTFGPPIPPRPSSSRCSDYKYYENTISSPSMSISEPILKRNQFGLTLDAFDGGVRSLTQAADTMKPVRESMSIRPKVISHDRDELHSSEIDELLKKWAI